MDEVAAEKKKKYLYIMENVAENGYDTSKFNTFYQQKYKQSLNVDSLSFGQVQEIVNQFKNQKREQKREMDEWADLAEFDAPYQSKESEAASLKKRSEIKTKKIENEYQTELSLKQVSTDVVSFKIHKGNILKGDRAFFQVETTIETTKLKYIVQRKDSDFYALRRVLVQKYPYALVPALPLKSKEHTEEEASKRQQVYNRFLLGVTRSEVLKSSKFLVDFLKLTKREEWKFNKQIHKRLKFSAQIQDVVSVEGEVSCKHRKNCEQYCDKIKKWNEKYANLTKTAHQLSKEVHQRSTQLAEFINKLAECFESLGKFNKKLKIQSQSKLFSRLSGLYYSQSLNLQNQGELTKIYCGQAMKYYELEHQPLEEILTFRNTLMTEYKKNTEALLNRKKALFSKPMDQWGFAGSIDELISRSQQLKKRDEAYKYMLSLETQMMQEKFEEVTFYTNQCLDECRRVGRYNGESLIDHFMDQAKIQQEYIEKQREKWAEFVDYFANIKWDKDVKKAKKAEKKDKKQKDKEKAEKIAKKLGLINQQEEDELEEEELQDEVAPISSDFKKKEPQQNNRISADTRTKESTITMVQDSLVNQDFELFEGPQIAPGAKVKILAAEPDIIIPLANPKTVSVKSGNNVKSILKKNAFSLIGSKNKLNASMKQNMYTEGMEDGQPNKTYVSQQQHKSKPKQFENDVEGFGLIEEAEEHEFDFPEEEAPEFDVPLNNPSRNSLQLAVVDKAIWKEAKDEQRFGDLEQRQSQKEHEAPTSLVKLWPPVPLRDHPSDQDPYEAPKQIVGLEQLPSLQAEINKESNENNQIEEIEHKSEGSEHEPTYLSCEEEAQADDDDFELQEEETELDVLEQVAEKHQLNHQEAQINTKSKQAPQTKQSVEEMQAKSDAFMSSLLSDTNLEVEQDAYTPMPQKKLSMVQQMKNRLSQQYLQAISSTTLQKQLSSHLESTQIPQQSPPNQDIVEQQQHLESIKEFSDETNENNFTLQELIEGQNIDFSLPKAPPRKSNRKSIVQELAQERHNPILRQQHVNQLTLSEQLEQQATRLKPVGTLKVNVSEKVQNLLADQTKHRHTVRLNEQLQKQISRMISLRLENSDSDDSSSSDSD